MKKIYYLIFMLLSLLCLTACEKDNIINDQNNNNETNNNDEDPNSNNNTPTITFPNANNVSYVDLGLPSGTLWATMNVGASKSEDYGDYFAWGETTTKDTYTWGNYKFMQNDMSHPNFINKYTFSDNKFSAIWYNENKEFIGDNKTVLSLEDDAAHVILGGDWRMPTIQEFKELKEECTWVWKWKAERGVNGYEVTGPNGESIFLPAAGDLSDSNLGIGKYGRYPTSCINESYSGSINFISFDYKDKAVHFIERYHGMAIRAVLPAKLNYTLKLEANGGEGTAFTSNAHYAEAVTIPTNLFTRNGYQFIGWNTTKDGTGISYHKDKPIYLSQDLTLYAQWNKQTISGTENGFSYVDLGLPSGTLWATMNVGASKPEDFGNYFAWGEVESWYEYDYDPYKWYNDLNEPTKYNNSTHFGFYDNKTTLELEDDAAHVNWGGRWRMPTKEEFEEIIDSNNCVWNFTNLNGTLGYKITSLKNGNNIFLPSAYGKMISGFIGDENMSGFYWSSSLDFCTQAYYLRTPKNISMENRRTCFSVRPVFRNL